MLAEHVTPEAINFMTLKGRGLICMPMAAERLDELEIPLMVEQNTARRRTAFCISIGAKRETTTGISAADRATTIRKAIDPDARRRHKDAGQALRAMERIKPFLR